MTFTQTGDTTSENCVTTTLFADVLRNRSRQGPANFDIGCLTAEKIDVGSLVNKGYENEYHVGATDMPTGRTFTTIQAAIDQAVLDGANVSGATIYIHRGFFIENLTISGNFNFIGSSSQRDFGSSSFLGDITVTGLPGLTVNNGVIFANLTFIDVALSCTSSITGGQDLVFVFLDNVLHLNLSKTVLYSFTEDSALTTNNCFIVDFTGLATAIHLINGALTENYTSSFVNFEKIVLATGTNIQSSGYVFSFIFFQGCVIEADAVNYSLLPEHPKTFIDCKCNKYKILVFSPWLQMINPTIPVDGIVVDPAVTDCDIQYTGGYSTYLPVAGGHYVFNVPNVPGVKVTSSASFDPNGLLAKTVGNYFATSNV